MRINGKVLKRAEVFHRLIKKSNIHHNFVRRRTGSILWTGIPPVVIISVSISLCLYIYHLSIHLYLYVSVFLSLYLMCLCVCYFVIWPTLTNQIPAIPSPRCDMGIVLGNWCYSGTCRISTHIKIFCGIATCAANIIIII